MSITPEPAACEICFNRPTTPLRHCPRCTAHICTPCFKAWLHVRIQYGSADHLTCLSCPEPITDAELRAVCGERAFRRCVYLRSRFAHRRDPTAAWCPIEGCWSLLPKPAPGSSTVLCPDCDQAVCSTCKAVAHDNTKCPTPTPSMGHRMASSVWYKLHTKKCPSCAVRIQRSGGCNQMHCTSCHTKFCWRCRGLLHLPSDLLGPDPREPQGSTRSRPLYGCICPRVHTTLSYIGVAGGLIVATPLALAVSIVVAPPALLMYAFLSDEHKRQVRKDIAALSRRF